MRFAEYSTCGARSLFSRKGGVMVKRSRRSLFFVANSGFPITPQVGSNRSGTGDTGRLPDRPSWNPDFKGNAILGEKEFKRTGRYYDPNAFLLPLAGTFGNIGRGQLRGPGFLNVATSLFKLIPL